MKHISFILLALLSFFALPQQTAAQNGSVNHEIFVSCGFLPINNLPSFSMPVHVGLMAQTEAYNKKKSPYIQVGYMMHFGEKIAAGLEYAYNSYKGDFRLRNSSTSTRVGKYKGSCHTIMLTAKYDWLTRGAFRFYSRIGAGVALVGKPDYSYDANSYEYTTPDREGKTRFAWLVAPLGVDWQFVNHLSLFVEGGVATTGCVNAGVKALF